MTTADIAASNDVPPGAPLPVDRRRTQRVRIGNLGIDTLSRTRMLNDIVAHALRGGHTRQIVTVNAQICVLAEKDARFRDCLHRAEFCCADGMPIAWAANRLAATPNPLRRNPVPRIAGVDLIEDICRAGAPRGLRIFLLGGVPGAARAAAAVLAASYPGIRVTGVSCPPFHFEQEPNTLQPVLDQIAAARTDVLFVALGAPRQELFIDEHIRPLAVPIAIGVGGSFEIISGAINRAPLWMQRAGLEWLYRLRQEPRRLWKRYLVGNAEFLLHLARWKASSSSHSQLMTPGS